MSNSGAGTCMIQGSYYFIMQDQPSRFAEALDAFLER